MNKLSDKTVSSILDSHKIWQRIRDDRNFFIFETLNPEETHDVMKSISHNLNGSINGDLTMNEVSKMVKGKVYEVIEQVLKNVRVH